MFPFLAHNLDIEKAHGRPPFHTHTPWLYVVLAEILSALIGLLAGGPPTGPLT
ncbi:MAG: hypothetical protein WBB70_16815 [Desulfobacterales bacterium]